MDMETPILNTIKKANPMLGLTLTKETAPHVDGDTVTAPEIVAKLTVPITAISWPGSRPPPPPSPDEGPARLAGLALFAQERHQDLAIA